MKTRVLVPRNFAKFYFKEGYDSFWKITRNDAWYAYYDTAPLKWNRASSLGRKDRLIFDGWIECKETDFHGILKAYFDKRDIDFPVESEAPIYIND